MEFFAVLIIIAVVVLVVILTYIGMNMTSKTAVAAFPPDQLACPDYWTQDANGNCIAGTSNLGVFKTGYSINPKKITGTGMTPICAQKHWANTNNVVWTGVDNYNKC
jgi:hypothetical protein